MFLYSEIRVKSPSRLRLNITNHTSQLSQSDSVVRVKGTEFPCGVWGKAPIVLPIVPRYSRIPSKPHLRITNYTFPKKQLSQSDSVVRVKGTRFPCGVWGKAPIVLPIVPRYSRIPSKPHLRITNYTFPKKQLSQSDSVVRVKGTRFPCGVWGKAPIVLPIVPEIAPIVSNRREKSHFFA